MNACATTYMLVRHTQTLFEEESESIITGSCYEFGRKFPSGNRARSRTDLLRRVVLITFQHLWRNLSCFPVSFHTFPAPSFMIPHLPALWPASPSAFLPARSFRCVRMDASLKIRHTYIQCRTFNSAQSNLHKFSLIFSLSQLTPES